MTLIEQLERADGPDRELDCRIFSEKEGLPFEIALKIEPNLSAWVAPHYTASIDAAMTLAPEGWGCSLHKPTVASPDAPCSARIWAPIKHTAQSEAKTPALALCIAALRARSQGGE